MKINLFENLIIYLNAGFTYAIKRVEDKVNVWLCKKYSGDHVYGSDVHLILTAKYDPNGALMPVPSLFKLQDRKKTKVVYKQVASIEDMISTLIQMKEQNNRIKSLWINAHGYPGGWDLSETCTIKNYQTCVERKPEGRGNIDRLREVLQMLDERALIVLLCCETGSINERGRQCVAQTLASLAPNHRVIAPIRDLCGLGLNLKYKNESIDVVFMGPKTTQREGIRGAFINLFYNIGFMYSFGKYGENITARFCDKKVCQMTKAQL